VAFFGSVLVEQPGYTNVFVDTVDEVASVAQATISPGKLRSIL
jgi:hypothetical protein